VIFMAMDEKAWEGFKPGIWQQRTDVESFVKSNITRYSQGSDFLEGPTQRTEKLWGKCRELLEKEQEKGRVLDIDTKTISTITSHKPGYIDRENELIFGLQTDAPLKRAIKPFGGIKLVEKACIAYGHKLDPSVAEIFTKYRKTHNDGVFSVYSEKMRELRRSGVITGLPDTYGRGRIIGDYRRPALYGADAIIARKTEDMTLTDESAMTEHVIRKREEISMQIQALKDLKAMAKTYGVDLGRPAENAREAIQWAYISYLAAVKSQDGAAMSLGRMDSFFDAYIERDIKKGLLDEKKAQELIDDFTIKLRLVRHLRAPEYDALFAGDPTWITIVLGGMGGGSHMASKTSFRFLNTLTNLGPAPEPNLTILWSKDLPAGFRKYCAAQSIGTSAIQYENDDLIREYTGEDGGIACCVSAMAIGKQMQFFGARCNLAKTLLMAINGGKDEKDGTQIGPQLPPLKPGPLDYAEVEENFDLMLDWLAERYVRVMNIIHYMHDKYYYEDLQMALHDTNVERDMAFGIAGLSVVADSLSAIKYAKVEPVRDERGITKEFRIKGDFPKYGNDDDRADSIAAGLVKRFIMKLKAHKAYRDSRHTLSVLTITSNIVYGEKTGATPDGRPAGAPFAPGANPMHGRDTHGAIASLNSVAKIPYVYCRDGVSNTFSISKGTLGKTENARQDNLISILDGYFGKGGQHLNVNVHARETLLDAMSHPEKYPQLTIRVSGYAVHFVKLSPEQQREVIARTIHESL